MVMLYARSLKGSRDRGYKRNRRGKKVSTLGAKSLKQMLISVNLLRTIDRSLLDFFYYQEARFKNLELCLLIEIKLYYLSR